MSIALLQRDAHAFLQRLRDVKRENPPTDFTWYGYDILGNLSHIERTLTADRRDVFERMKDRPLLDVGGADGDLAYFFEAHGYSVDLLDWGPTNWNGLRGARRLKELLGSKVGIHELDIDGPFELPQRYGMILFLGILYHLKNPFFALERFARGAQFMVLSTRVARLAPDRRTNLDAVSVGYLLGPDECNNDATNYWIFSRPGVRKLVQRAGWVIEDETSLGDVRGSDPVSPDHDERMFMLLRSRHA